MWMGGNVPFGYRVENRKLLIHEEEAATVRMIFERFLNVGSATILARTLNAEGLRRKNGKAFDKGLLYKLLGTRVYIGEAVHKGGGAIPASISRSSTGNSGTRCARSWRKAPANGQGRAAGRRRRCSRG